jgi:hypothetical protein
LARKNQYELGYNNDFPFENRRGGTL